jgi:NitT/TauT family transport system permease protein
MELALRRPLLRFVAHPRWLAFAIVFSVWHAVAVVRDTRVIPTPLRVGTEIWRIVSDFAFIGDLAASMLRIGAGFMAALLLGVAVGILMGSRKTWDEYLRDLVVFGLALPGLVYALIAVILFGQALWAAVLAIMLTSYPFIAVNVREGMVSLDKSLLEMGRVYRVGRADVLLRILIPSLLPFIFAGIRVGFSMSWKVNTLVEVFGSTNGVGWQIRASFDAYSVHGMLAWTFIFGAAMLLIEYGLLSPLERHFARWRPQTREVV